MPFGPNFEAGWSLKYLLGLEDSKLGQQCDPVEISDDGKAGNVGNVQF